MKYIVDISSLFIIYGMFTTSLLILKNQSKVLMISQIIFFIIGAYFTALGVMIVGMNVMPTVYVGALTSIPVGIIIFQLSEHYSTDGKKAWWLSVGLLFLSMFLSINIRKHSALSSLGLDGSFSHEYGFSDIAFLLLVFGISTSLLILYKLIEYLPIGSYFNSLPADQQLAQPRARRFRRFRYLLMVILSSAAGSFFTIYVGYIDPDSFQLKEGVFVLTILIVGTGIGNVINAHIGIILLISIPELFELYKVPYQHSALIQMLIFALAILIVLILNVCGAFEEDDEYIDYEN